LRKKAKTIGVVLDTNIHSSDSLRRTARFNALVRLAKSGQLRLHIPYIVQKEFLSQQTEQFAQLANSINNGIVELQHRTSPTLVKKLDEVKESFSKIQDNLVSYPALDFARWIIQLALQTQKK
jgi:predicted nucleic acid-binding protein